MNKATHMPRCSKEQQGAQQLLYLNLSNSAAVAQTKANKQPKLSKVTPVCNYPSL